MGVRILLLLALAAVTGLGPLDGGPATARSAASDVRAWASPAAVPVSDGTAAALVWTSRETVPGNAGPNRYTPTNDQLARFRKATDGYGRTATQENPLLRFVTGRPGLRRPSTDGLIQWVSHKWGIPTDWLRASLWVESRWRQSQFGDEEQVPARWYARYPPFSRLPDGVSVYRSLGIAQVKWIPDGSVGAGTEPLRWRSTAFNLDYYAASVRFYYNGKCGWCGAGYGARQAWNSIGAWYSPTPWANDGARSYVLEVKRALATQPWTHPGT